MRKLKKCPWCGSTPVLLEAFEDHYYVKCLETMCPIQPETKIYADGNGRVAAKMWNKYKIDFIPSLDLLQARLEAGCYIAKQDGEWWLWEEGGEGVCSGKTIRDMLVSLIWLDV